MKKTIAFFLSAFILMFAALPASAACRVVSLMYHNVTDDESRWDDWCISPEQLESDINYFMDNGYIPITASELANESMENLNGKKILLLTFDDGYEGWYTYVYPILQRCNAKATMFMVGAFVNRYGYLNEDQIGEMASSGLIEFGNHTAHIHQMPLSVLKGIYNSDNLGDIIADIKANNDYLKSITGRDVTSLSWPYGYTTSGLESLVRSELGFKISFTTNYGVNVYNGDASAAFNRINREHRKTSEQVYSSAENKF